MLTQNQIQEAPCIRGNLNLNHFLKERYPHANKEMFVKRCSDLYLDLVKAEIKIKNIPKDTFDSFLYYCPLYKFVDDNRDGTLLILSPFGGFALLDVGRD